MGLLDGILGAAGGGGGGLGPLADLLTKQGGDDFSHQDAHDLHEHAASAATPEQYQEAAHEAVSQMTPDQQQELHQHLTQQAQSQGLDVSSMLGGHEAGSAGGLASMLGGMQHGGGGSGGGGGLLSMLGGAGGLMGNPIAMMAITAIGGMLAKKVMK